MQVPQLSIPAVSKEQIYIPGVFAFDANSSDPANPTSLPVSVAFVAYGKTPADIDWKTASWTATWTAAAGATAYYLITAGSLTKGEYDVWLKVVGNVEIPERMVCQLIVT